MSAWTQVSINTITSLPYVYAVGGPSGITDIEEGASGVEIYRTEFSKTIVPWGAILDAEFTATPPAAGN